MNLVALINLFAQEVDMFYRISANSKVISLMFLSIFSIIHPSDKISLELQNADHPETEENLQPLTALEMLWKSSQLQDR